MRVEDVEVIALEVPLARNFGGSTYAVTKRCTIVTRLRTSDGVVSEVYNGDNRRNGGRILSLIRDEILPRIRGMSILDRERIWETMFTLSHASRDRATLLEAIACVDCAVWDIAGKTAGKSVREILGGHSARLPVISIGGYYLPGKTLGDIGREMEAYRAAGMAGCKFKVGGLSPEADAERVATARSAAGTDFVLMVDANRGWSAEEAIRFARLVEPLGIRWFEEPCHWYDDAHLMARVREATGIPIAAGQSEITSHGVRRLLDAKAVDIVNFDASEGGGVTDWRRAAALCAGAGVAMGHHEEPQIAQHLLAAIPHGTYLECFADPDRDPMWQSLWINRPTVRSGFMEISDGPGLGLQLDAEMITKYRVS